MKCRRIRISFVLGIIFVLFTSGLQFSEASLVPVVDRPSHVAVLYDKDAGLTESQMRYFRVFKLLGAEVTMAKLEDIQNAGDFSKRYSHVVVSSQLAVSLSEIELSKLLSLRDMGLHIILEGKSGLADRLGLSFSNEAHSISESVNKGHMSTKIKYSAPLSIPALQSTIGLDILSYDLESGAPIAAVLEGENVGKVLYLAVPLAQEDFQPYELYPFMNESLVDHMEVKPLVRRDGLVYFLDWGYHYAVDPKTLAQDLHETGVTEVHFSMWYELDKIEYFLHDFIEYCHAAGIKVIAWTEYPMVTDAFWENHPQWREKTGTLEDAVLMWRKLVTMDNPETRSAVKAMMSTFMSEYDFDGINIAEIYFESPNGIALIESMTPFSDYSREQFKALYGYDSMEVIKPGSPYYYKSNSDAYKDLVEYRVGLITEINRDMIEHAKALENTLGRDLEVYVTVIDSILDESIYESIGIDIRVFLEMIETYDISVIVEDPFMFWDKGPERYAFMSREYSQLTSHIDRVMFDINIIDRDVFVSEGKDFYPTSRQTGLELLELVSNASQNSGQVYLYAYNTVHDYDRAYITRGIASRVSVSHQESEDGETYKTTSEDQFYLITDTSDKDVVIDGQKWPVYTGESVTVPFGQHTVTILEKAETYSNTIRHFTGEITAASREGRDIVMTYTDRGSVFATLDKAVESLLIDGVERTLDPIYKDGDFTYKLPAGHHTAVFKSSATNTAGRLIYKTRELRLANIRSEQGILMAGARDLFEKLGAEYDYHSGYKSIAGHLNGYHIWLLSGHASGRVNNEDVDLQRPPYYSGDVLYVPLQDVVSMFGFTVQWDEENSALIIK